MTLLEAEAGSAPEHLGRIVVDEGAYERTWERERKKRRGCDRTCQARIRIASMKALC